MLEERELSVRALVPGMYVSRLDRPWEETPFPLQGVMVGSSEDVEQLARYCRNVVVDLPRSEPRIARRLQLLEREDEELELPAVGAAPSMFSPRDIEAARESMDSLSQRATHLLDMIHDGHGLSNAVVEAAIAPVIASVAQNPDAMLWLQVLRRHSDYQYGHAMNCCVLAVAFGRGLSLPEADLHALAVGGMLMNIGMVDVPRDLPDSPEVLDAPAHARIRDHVRAGLALFDASDVANAGARAMLQYHHERHDGSGYPSGLEGSEIPLFGRIAGIVDTYDAMTSERPWRPAVSRAAALQELYRQRDHWFQSELVEEFVKCLGVYPVGTLVELNTGEVAVVMMQNPVRRLRPRVMVLTDASKTLRSTFMALDLDRHGSGNPKPGVVAPDPMHIVRSLPPDSHGLDPRELFL